MRVFVVLFILACALNVSARPFRFRNIVAALNRLKGPTKEEEMATLISTINTLQTKKLVQLFSDPSLPDSVLRPSADLVRPCEQSEKVCLGPLSLAMEFPKGDSSLVHSAGNFNPQSVMKPVFDNFLKHSEHFKKDDLKSPISKIAIGEITAEHPHVPFQKVPRVISTTWNSRGISTRLELHAWSPNTIDGLTSSGTVSPSGVTYGTAYIAKSKQFLPNIYVTNTFEDLIIRHGVIFNKERAEQFTSLISNLYMRDHSKVKRVLNLSLMQGSCVPTKCKENSFLKKHNKFIRGRIQDTLNGKVELATINMNANIGVYEFMEKGSYKLSQAGFYKIVNWLHHDLMESGVTFEHGDRLGEALVKGGRVRSWWEARKVHSILREIRDLLCTELKVDCSDDDERHHEHNKNPHKQEGTNPHSVPGLYDQSESELESELESGLESGFASEDEYTIQDDEEIVRYGSIEFDLGDMPTRPRANAVIYPPSKLNRLHELLAATRALVQLNRPVTNSQHPLERVREFLLVDVVASSLHLTLTINCKSGIDRTGYVFSLVSAHRLMLRGWSSEDKGRFHMMIMSQKLFFLEYRHFRDVHTPQINKFVGNLELGTRQRNLAQHQGDLMRYQDDLNDIDKQILEFLNAVLLVQFNVGYHIVFMSTGVPGFKYGKYGKTGIMGDYNPIPPYIFPPRVMNGLILKTKEDNSVDFTEEFFSVLTDTSCHRKS